MQDVIQAVVFAGPLDGQDIQWFLDDAQHPPIPPDRQANRAARPLRDKEALVAKPNPRLDLDQGRGQSVDRLARRAQYIEG